MPLSLFLSRARTKSTAAANVRATLSLENLSVHKSRVETKRKGDWLDSATASRSIRMKYFMKAARCEFEPVHLITLKYRYLKNNLNEYTTHGWVNRQTDDSQMDRRTVPSYNEGLLFTRPKMQNRNNSVNVSRLDNNIHSADKT